MQIPMLILLGTVVIERPTVSIKLGQPKTISHYDDVLHLINLTLYDEIMRLLSNNTNTLKTITFEDK